MAAPPPPPPQALLHSHYHSEFDTRDYNASSTLALPPPPPPQHPPPYPLSPSEAFFAAREELAKPEPVYAMGFEGRTGTTHAAGHERAHSHSKSIHMEERYRAANSWDGGERMGFVDDDGEGQRGALDVADQRLKRHIRILRLISRILAFIVSILVFVPITMTLAKFLTTNTVLRVVTVPATPTAPQRSEARTAWAKESTTWPTYMYFGTAAVSLLLNLFIMGSYLRKNVATSDLKLANKGAYVATTFSWIVMIANAVVWGVAASLYRTERRDSDLWGWTCSDTAQSIQKVFEKEVDFKMFCNVQSYSWYAGVVQALLAVLTVVVFALILKRRKTQKKLAARQGGDQVVLLRK